MTQASCARVLGWARHVDRGALDARGVGRRGRRVRGRRRPARSRARTRSSASVRAPPARSRSRSSTRATSSPQDILVPALRANALYEGKYPLVSALSRPVIVEHLVASARRHRRRRRRPRLHRQGQRPGAVRGVVADPRARPRSARAGPRVGADPRRLHRPRRASGRSRSRRPIEKLYSIDENMWGRAIECGVLENPWSSPPEEPYTLTRERRRTRPPSRATIVVGFDAGVPVCLDGEALDLVDAHRRARRGRRRLRLGPHRHGREPARRHQEPRGLRVPGVARARSSRTRTSKASRSNVTSRARSSASRSASPS